MNTTTFSSCIYNKHHIKPQPTQPISFKSLSFISSYSLVDAFR